MGLKEKIKQAAKDKINEKLNPTDGLVPMITRLNGMNYYKANNAKLLGRKSEVVCQAFLEDNVGGYSKYRVRADKMPIGYIDQDVEDWVAQNWHLVKRVEVRISGFNQGEVYFWHE